MRKAVALLTLLGGCWSVYWLGFHKSPAYKAYLQWTQATLDGDCKTLYLIADGPAKEWVDSFCGASGGLTVGGQPLVSSTSAAAMVAELRNTPAGAMKQLHHDLESEEEAPDGTVSLSVVETVLGRPSQFNKPPPPRRHKVKVKEEGGTWKLVEFKEEDI
ncbi:MAG TPA: hypothetical protein VMV05_12595 [bacterium]|nr:hypothetical protein [bacterium]